MAYANKYKITFATKTSKTAYLYLQEDGYTGSVIEYKGVSIQLQYIPTSDNPFEPIYASQLGVTIDITDDMANMPNFITTNDRKYFVELYLGTDLEWCGFTISDDIHLSFTTGRKNLSFNCIDALGMIKDKSLAIPNTININDSNTILYYILLCLNSINLPTNPNIITACSFYGNDMVNRSTGTANEPFNQSYLPYRTFLTAPNTYMNCLDVITNILLSFGCRLFMSGGKWWIVSINEFANENVYYTEYTYTGSVASSGQFNNFSEVQGYTSNTSNVYFIDNNQTKILRKGFNRIDCNHSVEQIANYFSNGNLRPNLGGSNIPTNWNASYTGSGSSYTIISNANDSSDQWRLVRSGVSGANVIIYGLGMPTINGGEILNFGWTYFGQDLSGSRGAVYVKITDGTTIYYWGGEATGWTSTPSFFYVPAYESTGSTLTDGGINQYKFSTAAAPIKGLVSFSFKIDGTTCSFVSVGNFILNITPLTQGVNYSSFISGDNQYSTTIDLPYGFYVAGTTGLESGCITKSNGTPFNSWYQYSKPTLAFPSLSGLIMQQYINVYANNIINVDGAISSFETANGYINAAKMFKFTDTDPSQINISDKSYMLGNSTIDYYRDEIRLTLLQISDTTIEATNNYQVILNNNYNF